jgi:hypothetical protein
MSTLVVMDGSMELRFGADDLMRYHGPGYPGGVAHAFKVMERAFPLLAGGAPPQRRAIRFETAFPGPGARDGFELVTRAVTGGRYVVDAAFAGPEVIESPAGRYLFRLIHGDVHVTLTLRPGHVREEFVQLSRLGARTPEQEARLTELKHEMADRLLRTPAAEVYDAAQD